MEARVRVRERMDDPSLPAPEHRAALAGLARIHLVSGTVGMLARRLRRRFAGARVLDLACGRGDVTAGLFRRGIAIEGCDLSERALSFARAAHPSVRFFAHDLSSGVPPGYDVYVCTLFLHHLGDGEAVDLLASVRDAGGALLVCDLARTRFGLALAATVPHLLTRSAVVHEDAALSVRAAFTADEARALAGRAGLDGAAVTRCWPARFLLEWSPA